MTGAGQPVGAAAVEGLRRNGASVVGIDTSFVTDRDLAHIGAQVNDAVSSLGGLDALVISGWDPALLAPVAFEDVDDAMFEAMWEGGMKSMVWTLQTAIPHLQRSGGNVVVIVATSAMSGAANFAVASATFEAQRILMKAAARQLGPEHIRVNAIAVGPELIFTDATAADVHYLAPNAIAGEQSADDVVGVIEFLIGQSGRHLSGQTITIDGGRWFAP